MWRTVLRADNLAWHYPAGATTNVLLLESPESHYHNRYGTDQGIRGPSR